MAAAPDAGLIEAFVLRLLRYGHRIEPPPPVTAYPVPTTGYLSTRYSALRTRSLTLLRFSRWVIPSGLRGEIRIPLPIFLADRGNQFGFTHRIDELIALITQVFSEMPLHE